MVGGEEDEDDESECAEVGKAGVRERASREDDVGVEARAREMAAWSGAQLRERIFSFARRVLAGSLEGWCPYKLQVNFLKFSNG